MEFVHLRGFHEDAFKGRAAGEGKRSARAGDFTHLVDVAAAGMIGLGAAYSHGYLLGTAAALAIWHLFTIVVHDFGLLWFDDLLDLFEGRDPRVQSFRRLSLHVLLQIGEIIVLFAVLYRFVEPDLCFRDHLFGSFEATMTLNRELNLTPGIWVIQICTSVLVLVYILSVVAGERHARHEIATNPASGWGHKRRLRDPFPPEKDETGTS